MVPDGGEVFDATLEVPITIRNPDKRIGTHVFTAVARNDAGLRWIAVTIDDGDDAKDALDRITIPQDVLDRIAPSALPRSSIVISDEPLSGETNYRTEFVAVLNNQPQGGFVTRRPTADVAVASGNFCIARGRQWLDDVVSGRVTTVAELCAREKCSVRQVNMIISLAFLAPDLVKAVVEGRLPRGIGVERLRDPPTEWSRQFEALGLNPG